MKKIAIIHWYGNERINPKVFIEYKKCLENYISNNPFDIIISSGWFTDKNIHESEAEAIKKAISDNINFDWERILEEKSFRISTPNIQLLGNFLTFLPIVPQTHLQLDIPSFQQQFLFFY